MKAVLSRLPLGIRLQLTLWYMTVFAVLMLCAGYLVYKHMENSLAQSLDTSLAFHAEQIASGVRLEHGLVTIDDAAGNLPGSTTSTSPINEQQAYVDISENIIARVVDVNGHALRASPGFQLLHISKQSGQSWHGVTVSFGKDEEERLYSKTLTDHGVPFAVVQVGESLIPIRTLLRDQALDLLLLAPFVLFVCGIVSYWLAARAFAPIHRLTFTARRIGAGDLQQRVPVPQARDEIHFLAVTLNEMIERLDDAFKRQRRFVADASHELRTPVAAIRSKSDVSLLQSLQPYEYVRVLQGINTETERLGHLISDLLALARADEGQSPLAYEPVQLDVLVEAVAANAELLAQERGITVRVHAPQPVTIKGDEARLIQVVMNLLDNALIYTRRGGSVTLSIACDAKAAYITVRDTGEGIAPEHLSHIFERFYRADPARTRREGGSSGLGLAIVDWVVYAHGGTVKVESQLGQGSTFTVTLPLTIPEQRREVDR